MLLPRGLLVIVFIFAIPCSAEEMPNPQRPPVIPHLPQLANKSGYIFSGTVKSVDRITPTSANSVPVMQITFQVEHGYAGVHSGRDLVIREYAGLWQSGERYHPGQRVMLFLYPPSKLGLTSPVGGARGRYLLDPRGRIIINPPRSPGSSRSPIKPTLLDPNDFARALRDAR